MIGALVNANAAEPPPPEQVFRMHTRTLDAQTVEVRFDIEPGYYLYRERFRLEAEPDDVTLGDAEFPQGQAHHDDFFGTQEIYRDTLQFKVPVASNGARTFKLLVTAQGCADMGICYPPLTQRAEIDLAGMSNPTASVRNSVLEKLTQPPAPASQARAPANPRPAASAARPPPASPPTADESGRIAHLLKQGNLILTAVSFFGFGLLLSLTPCMLPMVPILSSIIVGHSQRISRSRAFVLSCAYVLGMALTYTLAGVGAGLSGTLLSGALQNVWVLSVFASIFVALSLSMFGFYELQLPASLQSKLSGSANEQGGSVLGIFTMGSLSALIVGPCVAAPLAGALLYIAQTQNVILGGIALFSMALGMGVLLIAAACAAHHWSLKTGPWMEKIKQSFGAILLGTAIWLVSPVIPSMASLLLWGLLAIGCAIFLRAIDPLPIHAPNWQRAIKVIGILLLLYGGALVIGAFADSRDPLQPLAGLTFQHGQAPKSLAFQRIKSVAELDRRIATAGRPVMLDFYADWCVSCKEMEHYTFSDPAVQQKLAHYLLLQADVSANDDEDKSLLKRFNLFGPPGIIFFDARGDEIRSVRIVGYQAPEEFLRSLAALPD